MPVSDNRDWSQGHHPPPTTTTTSHVPRDPAIVESSTSRDLPRESAAPRPSPGKRKRRRPQMITSPGRQRMDDAANTTAPPILKRYKSEPGNSRRPNLGEPSTHSDDDDDTGKLLGPPPPPLEPVAPELVCRYPNKPCAHPRTYKKHGELHSYCDYHRTKAQQYQRKLEQKKRERRMAGEKSPSAMLAASSITDDVVSPTVRHPSVGDASPAVSFTTTQPLHAYPSLPSSHFEATRIHPLAAPHASATMEPFHHPVSLEESDIRLLQVFLMDASPERHHSVPANSAAPAPSANRPRSSHDESYSVSLDGFSFTSGSL